MKSLCKCYRRKEIDATSKIVARDVLPTITFQIIVAFSETAVFERESCLEIESTMVDPLTSNPRIIKMSRVIC